MSALIDRIAQEAEREPERVVPVLQALLGEEVELTEQLRTVARVVGDQRSRMAVQEFMQGSLVTRQAAEQLGVSSPQAVHQLRARGRLLGRTIGNQTYWPAWQFTGAGLRDDLGDVLADVTAFTTDALAADRIMRLPREDLDGRSIAEALDVDACADDAWQILRRLGAGF